MIIQRLATAIRRQDWFQVLIEILIVIIGIYLGFQVTEWGQEREDRAAEAEYLARFHDEVFNAIQTAEGSLELNVLRSATMREISKKINSEDTSEQLTQLECHNLFASHINAARLAVFPTIVELNSSGKMDLIQNNEIRNAMINYELDHDLWSTQEERGNQGLTNLFETYPELIQVDMTMTSLPQSIEAINSFNHTCDLAAMRSNPGFRNHVVDNTILRALMVMVFTQYSERLKSTHELLDRELGVTHTEDPS